MITVEPRKIILTKLDDDQQTIKSEVEYEDGTTHQFESKKYDMLDWVDIYMFMLRYSKRIKE
ncbi:MAG: hypothetical protein IJ193_08120 [Bacilli bacterium]|nr:hypothetical protein [Bacilli bacterium]